MIWISFSPLAMILIFITIISVVVECTLTLSLTQNVFPTKGDSFDPFEDEYVRKVLRMDRKSATKMPILDDDTFMYNLNHSIYDMIGKYFVG